MIWMFILGMATTLIIEVLACMIIYGIMIGKSDNGGRSCVSCGFYSVGTNTCIKNCAGAKIVDNPINETCDSYRGVL